MLLPLEKEWRREARTKITVFSRLEELPGAQSIEDLQFPRPRRVTIQDA
jgi:hypothetical protein